MSVHDYSDNMMGSLNAVLGSYECQHYRFEHYFVHVVQVFSKIQHICIFIEWGTFCHSIRDRFCQWQNLSNLLIPSSSIIIPSVPSQKFAMGLTLHNQSHFTWRCLKILLTNYTRCEKIRCQNQAWWSFLIYCNWRGLLEQTMKWWIPGKMDGVRW